MDEPALHVSGATRFPSLRILSCAGISVQLSFRSGAVIPVSQGGEDDEANLALACRSCNLHKGIDVSGVDPISGEVVRLFHPRLDRWSGHFQVDRVTGRIVGITPVGKATASRLNLNSASQLLAKRQWMRLGVFP